MEPAFLSLLAFLIGGGGSDLLDYVPPDAYWKDKQVIVSVESMAGELKPAIKADVSALIDNLNSGDPQVRQQAGAKIAEAGPAALPALRDALLSPSPQTVLTARELITTIDAANRPVVIRRLMAIRELGDLKNKAALPILEPLLKSEESFEADYASAAINEIGGKPFSRPRPANLRDDVWLLPDGCRAVGQVLGPAGEPGAVEKMLKDFPVPPNQDRAVLTESFTHMLVGAAETVGDIRLDAITFGIAGDIGERNGYVVLIAHGRFDRHAVGDLLHKQQVPSNVSDGVEIFQPPGAEMLFCFPSDNYALLVGSPGGVEVPVQQILAAIKTGQGKLKAVPEMKKPIDAAPADQPIWAVAKITPAFAQAPVLAPFETVKLQTRMIQQGIAVTMTGTGSQPDKAKSAANMVNAGVKEAAEELKRDEQYIPGAKVIANALASVKCEANEGNATLTSRIDASQSALLVLPLFMGRSMDAQVVPAPATQPVDAPAK